MSERYYLPAHVIITPTEYGSAILDTKSSQYWTLNQTGAFVADHLSIGADPPEIARLMAEEFDVPASSARADVLELLEELRSQRLVVKSRRCDV